MRLTDNQILHIFSRLSAPRGGNMGFLRSYAEALCQATRKDFYILRPASMILIAKYNLGQFLEDFKEGGNGLASHDYPPRRSA